MPIPDKFGGHDLTAGEAAPFTVLKDMLAWYYGCIWWNMSYNVCCEWHAPLLESVHDKKVPEAEQGPCLLQRFRPITLERPKVLLPLVGVPLLDYTLEWLASNNVAEVQTRAPARLL